MARKKFEEGFKENAIEYCKIHSDKTIKACAAELGIGYSTLRRWIAQNEEQAEAAGAEANDAIMETATEEEEPGTVDTPIIDESSIDENQENVDSESIACDIQTKENIVEEKEPIENVQDDADALAGNDYVVQADALQEDFDDEFDWVSKREQVKNQLGDIIESAGNGVSDAVQLIGLYKKRHDLKKVQKKLQKEKEKRMKQ